MALRLSVVIPVYYGEKTITDLVDVLHRELASLAGGFEVLLVNDGSKDGSDSACRALAETYAATVSYFELARNFSEHNAVMVGLNYCNGQYAVIIDDDFQNPPSEILKLLERIEATRTDVVYSRYAEKKHSLFRNIGSKFNDLVANFMLGKPRNLYLSSFKILKRNLIDEVIKYRGPFPYIDGLILRSTHHIETQLVTHAARNQGKSNYTLRKLIALWSNMFVNFSIRPLRVALHLGMLLSVVGFVLAAAFTIERLTNATLPLGWASLIVTILVVSGVQLMVLGVLGEFLGRLYMTETSDPQFVVRDIVRGSANSDSRARVSLAK